MHFAAANGKKDLVKTLLEHGADATMVNNKEQLAIDYANMNGFNEITALLVQYSPNVKNKTNTETILPNEKADESIHPDISSKKQALLDLKELLDAGILTQDEFDVEKKKLLA